ncbi:MAG: thermonuclease family protein [Synechococcus sp. MIT S9220]|nr:thermonuclease family protein [Synechococcus sp. MIT S9220]
MFYLLITILATVPAVQAHGGGLNSQGCHTNKSNGNYHCHRGDDNSSSQTARFVKEPVRLVSVGDGDTIRVIDKVGKKITIRLACIDAPETSQRRSGDWSTKTLQELISNQKLFIKTQAKDRYGRTVAEVYVNSKNINLQLVRIGAAYAYRKYLNQCDQSAYIYAEDKARQLNLGIWGIYMPNEKPWEHRQLRRK